MHLEKIMKLHTATLLLLGTLLAGCGGGSSSNAEATDTTMNGINLPDGLTMIFFDNTTSRQYLYDSDSEKYEDMNSDSTQNYDMSGKHGLPIVWFHESATGVDQKLVMLNDAFSINDENVSYRSFHYLGHFHEENNEKHFAAHRADEFNPDNNASSAKLATLEALNAHLLQQEEIKAKIANALPSGESLCNYYVLEEHEDNATHEEAMTHIALSATGQVYVLSEQNGTLQPIQAAFGLEGVSYCESDKSAIVKANDHGVIIFSTQSQKLYLVDNHGLDFHQHSTWDIAKFLPAGFTPTVMTSIVEEGAHDH